jgi:hypothetical protein
MLSAVATVGMNLACIVGIFTTAFPLRKRVAQPNAFLARGCDMVAI